MKLKFENEKVEMQKSVKGGEEIKNGGLYGGNVTKNLNLF